ncbi:MAG: energy transducer TonB [Steroidobacteraceae bacterium]
MGVYTQSEGSNWLSRRGAFLFILIAFHIVLLWALKSGFAVKFVQSITEPIKAEIINEVKPEEPPPPPPEVRMELPPVQVPPVLVDIQIPSDPPPTALQAPITTDPTPQPPAPPAPPRPPVAATKAVVTYKPDTFDYYPSTSRNLGEEGKLRVRLCVGVNGRVTEAAVGEGSGIARLDEAGVRLAKQYRFKPATEDGKPVAQCFLLPVSFSLKDGG